MIRPGEFCQHSADEPHNTSSSPTEPMLCLYFWGGKLSGDQWHIEQGQSLDHLDLFHDL